MAEQSTAEQGPQENTFSRMATMKNLADRVGLPIREDLKDDEHFWYLTAREYWRQRKTTIETAKAIGQTIRRDESLKNIRTISIKEAINQALKFYELEKEAATDGLTGAFNRKALDSYLLNLLKRRRQGTIDTITLFDIDNFKSFNEEYGHPVGDAVLKELVKLIKEQIRGIDIVARYGGEEFVIIFPSQIGEKIDGVEETMLRRIDEIREKIATELKERVKAITGKEINREITASFGLMFIDDSVTAQNLSELNNKVYDEVDRCLRQAKSSGKNTVANLASNPRG